MKSVASRFGLALVASGVGWLAVRTLLHASRGIDYNGRVIMITGGSRGLGLCMAKKLADQGAIVAICSRDASELESAARELRGRGATVHATVCDVTRRHEAEAWAASVLADLGKVDVLINNAGIIQVSPLGRVTRDDFEDAMDTHYWACLNLIAAVLPMMRRRGEGRIINIASVGGLVAVPHLLPYCASKFALVGLSRGLRSALAKDNIFVTTVCPGLMRTGSYRHAMFKGDHEAEYTWFSLGATAPILSVSAERAAAAILAACRVGRAELTLPWPAQLAAKLQSFAPELAAEVLSLAASALPTSEHTDGRTLTGIQVQREQLGVRAATE